MVCVKVILSKVVNFSTTLLKVFLKTFAEKWLYFLTFSEKLVSNLVYFFKQILGVIELLRSNLVYFFKQKLGLWEIWKISKPWPNFFETVFGQIWSNFLNKFSDFHKCQKWLYFFVQILLHYFARTDRPTRIKFFETFFRYIWSSFLNKIFGIFSDLYTK